MMFGFAEAEREAEEAATATDAQPTRSAQQSVRQNRLRGSRFMSDSLVEKLDAASFVFGRHIKVELILAGFDFSAKLRLRIKPCRDARRVTH